MSRFFAAALMLAVIAAQQVRAGDGPSFPGFDSLSEPSPEESPAPRAASSRRKFDSPSESSRVDARRSSPVTGDRDDSPLPKCSRSQTAAGRGNVPQAKPPAPGTRPIDPRVAPKGVDPRGIAGSQRNVADPRNAASGNRNLRPEPRNLISGRRDVAGGQNQNADVSRQQSQKPLAQQRPLNNANKKAPSGTRVGQGQGSYQGRPQ